MVQSVGILCSGAPKKNAALLAKKRSVLCFGGYLHPVVVEVANYILGTGGKEQGTVLRRGGVKFVESALVVWNRDSGSADELLGKRKPLVGRRTRMWWCVCVA